METDRHRESQNRPAKQMPIVEEEENEDEGHRVTSINSTAIKDSDSKVVCKERVKSKGDFKAPMLPATRKMKPVVPKLNGHVTPNDLSAVEQLSIKGESGNSGDHSYSELLDPFVTIGKHCYLCPHSRQFIASTYPSLPPRSTTGPRKKGSELNGPPEEFIKEIILDDFSLLLFHSTQDYKLFKEKEDELREKEQAEGRRRLAEERRRLYEENLLLGKVKKKGRKSKDLEREQKEVRRRERLERREQRRRATYGQRVQRRREKREQGNLEEGASISPEERAARRLSRREAREERQRLREQRKQEEKRLRRQAKLQLQQQHQQDPFHTGEQVALSAESGGCAIQTTTSMARGLSTSMQMPGSNSQPPSVGHAAARPQSGTGHPNGASSSTIAVGNQQQSSKGEELKVGVKRSFSTIGIGIAQTKSNAVLDGGGSGDSYPPAVRHSPMSSMNKARKLDSDPTAGLRETLIGIAVAQQQEAKRPPVDASAYSHSNNAPQLATPSDGVLLNPSMLDNNSHVTDPLLLLSQHMLAHQLMQTMGSHSRTTQPATAPTNTSNSRLPDPNSLLLSSSPAGIGALLLNSPQLLTQNPQLLFNYLSEQQQRKIQQSHIPVAGNLNHHQSHHSTSSLPRTTPMDNASSSSSSLSAAKPPISDISFPAGAALASQLAGAAILGGKSLTSSSSTQGTGNDAQQRATTHSNYSNAIARKKVCWCNMHVHIAQFIARQQEMQRLGSACHSRKLEGSQPSTSYSGQQTMLSNASVLQNVQQLQNFITASGLFPASIMGPANYAQVPLANTLHNQQQMALLASAGLLQSTLAPQSSQLANLPSQAVRQQKPPSLLRDPLQSMPSSTAGLMTYPASNQLPPFAEGMAQQHQQQHQYHQHHQQVGKNVSMQLPAASALGFPVMPVSLGASGSLTSGTSNAAANAAAHLQQNSAANLARLVAGTQAGTLSSSGAGGTGGVMEGGGSIGDVQAGILAQLLLSQIAGNSIVPSTTPILPSAAGPCSSTMSSLDSQAIAAIASLLGGGSAASLPANLLPRAQNQSSSSSSYMPLPVPATPIMTDPAPLANLMFPSSTATTVPHLQPVVRGVQKAVSTTAQGSNIQQMPLTQLSAQDTDRNTQMSMMSQMAAANHLVLPQAVLPSHHQQLPQPQFKQQLPHHMAPPQQPTISTNKAVTATNADSGAASGSQSQATGQNTPLNSLLLSPPNSARLASLPPIEQELAMRRYLYTLFMNLGATQAANTTNPPIALPNIRAVPSVPTSTLPSSPTRPTNVVHDPCATAASVIPPPPEWKELRTTSTGIGTTITTASTTMTKESVVTKKEEGRSGT